MTKLQIQQLNSTTQLTATDLNLVYGGIELTAAEQRFLATLKVAGLATIETGDDPIDVRFRIASTGEEFISGVRLFSD